MKPFSVSQDASWALWMSLATQFKGTFDGIGWGGQGRTRRVCHGPT